MTARQHPVVTLVAAILLIAGAACSESNGESTEVVSTVEERATGAQTPAAPQAIELTNDTLAAYERGLKREIEAVRAAQQKSAAATTSAERGAAIQGSFEHVTIPQGAEAAGLPAEEYRVLRETINGIFQTLDFQDKIDGPMSIDLSRADAATKARVSRDPFADLSSGSAAALRGQMDRLVPVWIEYVNVTAVAG
jgi:hypothetical protein